MYSAEDETRGADASQLGVAASNTRRFHEDLKPIAGGRSEKKAGRHLHIAIRSPYMFVSVCSFPRQCTGSLNTSRALGTGFFFK
jgi:hypothetical protein